MNKLVVWSVLVLTAVASVRGYEPITGRSHRWDEVILEHEARHKRQANSPWQSGRGIPCTLGDYTRFDVLRRRNSGFLAPVADQGMCGSCWAFAAAHAVTDTRSIAARGQTDLLSVQYTNRCATEKHGFGCCGDYPENALEHYKNTGVATDTCLPYNERSSRAPKGIEIDDLIGKSEKKLDCFLTCNDGSPYDPNERRINNWRRYESLSDDMIIDALNRNQMVIVAMLATKKLHMLYRCGVYTSTETGTANHAVVIVDYGTDNGVDFWVIKNSWGTDFGEDGYFRIKRGDLGIGSNDVYMPILSPDVSTPTSSNAIETCAPEEVSNPDNDLTTRCAVDFALETLAANRKVNCSNGQAATSLNLTSFEDASVQIVAGMWVEMTMEVRLGGCGMSETIMLHASVSIDLDSMFTLEHYNTVNTANMLTASMLLLITTVIASLVINN